MTSENKLTFSNDCTCDGDLYIIIPNGEEEISIKIGEIKNGKELIYNYAAEKIKSIPKQVGVL